MVTNQEYFTVELASEITLAIPLDEMGTVTQFERTNICTVPGIADFWYGVGNHNGSLLWLLDSDRFFELELQSRKPKPKLTAVTIENQQFGKRKRVAIVIQHLKGIMTLDKSDISSVDEAYPQLNRCCSTIARIDETRIVHIVDSAALLEQLFQRSMLAST